ncbi:MAG: hypothetical protein MK105_04870 [Crocinitomicaceae bacterium]|nr:hypothetical protein [Crocinitomicaceae bacterium]
MKFAIIIILFTSILLSCKTNGYIRYHNRINEAEFSFFNGDYNSALKHYQNAFHKVHKPFENDLYYYAVCLWEVKDYNTAIKTLDTLTKTNFALTKSGFFQGINSELKDSILKANSIFVDSINNSRINHPLRISLDSVFNLDIELRNKLYNSLDSIQTKELWKQIHTQDSNNLEYIKSINFVGGVHLPCNPRKVGELLIHQLDWVNNNKKTLKKAIKDGRLSPVHYASSYDYSMVHLGSDKVYYGQWSELIQGQRPKKIFNRSIRIGVSPYFKKDVNLPKKKGMEPLKLSNYEYYSKRKNHFNCYRWWRLLY